MLAVACQALVGAGVKEQVIEEAQSPGCGLAACVTLGLCPFLYVGSSEEVSMLRSSWCAAALRLLAMGPAIERLAHVTLVMTHCRMSYLRIPKGAINVLPHCAYSPGYQKGSPSAVVQAAPSLASSLP